MDSINIHPHAYIVCRPQTGDPLGIKKMQMYYTGTHNLFFFLSFIHTEVDIFEAHTNYTFYKKASDKKNWEVVTIL